MYIEIKKLKEIYWWYTSNFRRSNHEHFTGKGSMTTRKYKPIEIERVIPCYNIKYAITVKRKITQWYRLIYGKIESYVVPGRIQKHFNIIY